MQQVFVRELEALRQYKPLTLSAVAGHLQDKGLILLAFLANLPFMQPIPLPGLSTLLGFVIALQAIGLLFFGKPLMTAKMKQVEIPAEKLELFIRAATKVKKWLPGIGERWPQVANHKITHVICGIFLLGLALFLSLPLPLPSSNFLPALGIFLICLGLLESDSLMLLLGIAYTLALAFIISMSSRVLLAEVENWLPSILSF